MRTLVATLKQLGNMTELAGFVTEFSDAVRARGKHDAAYVKDQDALASTAFKLCVSLVGERLFSMQSHELVYPYALGGLAADEDAVVLQTTERFRSHWEVWAEAMRVKIPSVARAAERCSLNTPAMRQLARILRKGDYKDVSAAKREGVKLFSGFGQTVINENANSKVRDAELRQQSARRLVEWKAWEVPHAKRVLNQFERAEVAPTSVLCGLARVDGTSLFHGSGDPKLEFPSLNFAKLLTGFDGPSPDALGRRKLGAELALLLELKRLGKWELMADAWQAALAPSHEFVLDRQASPPRVYFVLKSFDVGLLTWSCKRVGRQRYQARHGWSPMELGSGLRRGRLVHPPDDSDEPPRHNHAGRCSPLGPRHLRVPRRADTVVYVASIARLCQRTRGLVEDAVRRASDPVADRGRQERKRRVGPRRGPLGAFPRGRHPRGARERRSRPLRAPRPG